MVSRYERNKQIRKAAREREANYHPNSIWAIFHKEFKGNYKPKKTWLRPNG